MVIEIAGRNMNEHITTELTADPAQIPNLIT